MGELASIDMEKAELLTKFFASVFTHSQAFHISQIPEPLLEGLWCKVPITVS